MTINLAPPVMRYFLIASIAWATALGVCRAGAGAGSRSQLPQGLEGVGVEEHRDTQLPMAAKFRDQDGQVTTLGEIFDGEVPVILSLNYSSCPMLCSMQLTGLANSLRSLEWSAGSQFRVVSISIDPSETYRRAKESRDKYAELYGRGTEGWTFLVGPQPSIDVVTEAVGFQYKYLSKEDEYSHPAVAVLCTPDGRISRYLYGVDFSEQMLRLSLVEASEGKIGGAGEQLLLFCFHYDPQSGTYAPRFARLAMSVGGFVTVLAMAAGILMMRSRGASPAVVDATEPDSPTNGAG